MHADRETGAACRKEPRTPRWHGRGDGPDLIALTRRRGAMRPAALSGLPISPRRCVARVSAVHPGSGARTACGPGTGSACRKEPRTPRGHGHCDGPDLIAPQKRRGAIRPAALSGLRISVPRWERANGAFRPRPGPGPTMAAVSFTVRAITLDLDDTLWPFAPIGARIDQVLYEWMLEHSPATAAMFP